MKRSPRTGTELLRRRLTTALGPLELLRQLRFEPRLVALLGAWHQGEALIAFNPARLLRGDPFDGIDLDRIDTDGAFGGGWIGSWGYQLGALIERLPPPPPRPQQQPHFTVGFYDYVLRCIKGTWWFEALVTPDRAALIDAEFVRVVGLLDERPAAPVPYTVGAFNITPTPAQHQAVLARTLEHIRAGDIFQANVCVRLEAPFSGDPLDVFCRGVEVLRPAYAAFVRGSDGDVASMSPELFLRRTGDDLISSPIKGTAALTSDVAELAASAKDRAENVMIVDLMRNDLGRVCVPGTIRVPALNRVERHSVWHLVSDVVGTVRPGLKDSEVLRATFPPGSVTGAPKVRAMELINTVEATGREAYTGAIGHISPCAGMELNVAIRTFEFAADRVWLGVGGGIVADSTPAAEFAECLIKARPLIDAIGGRLVVPTEPTEMTEPAIRASRRGPTNTDRGIDASRGIFETLLVVDGQAIDVARHVARLEAGVQDAFATSLGQRPAQEIARRAATLVGTHRLRIDAVRRPGGGVATTLTTAAFAADPAAAWTLIPRIVAGGQGPHKWIDRRRLEFDGNPDQDVLLIDVDDAILETARANIFVVRDEGVYTPPLDGRILPGTARARVIEILVAAGIPLLQRRLTAASLATAAEVFATNALRGVVPVIDCAGIGKWPVGRTTNWIAEQLRHAWGGGAAVSTLAAEVDAGAPPRGKMASPGASVLLIDNFDSFVYNLAQYFGELGAATTVVRNDEVTVDQLVAAHARGEFTHLVVSPGPGTPAAAGISNAAIRRLGPHVPTLGVCLGHQCIGEVFGASVVRAPEVVHGKPSLVHHDGLGVFTGIGTPLVAARYHSLTIDPATLPAELAATAHTAGGVIMGVRHENYPVEGVQMHPESILTAHGHEMLANFLHTID